MSRSAKRFFMVLMLGTIAVLGIVLFKLGPGLLLAATLAVMLWPVQQWLSKKFRGHRSLAAGLLTFGVVSLLVTPVVGLSAFVVREAGDGWRFVTTTLEEGGVDGLVERLPESLQGFANEVVERLPARGKLEQTVNEQAGKAAAAAGGMVAATGSALFQIAMMLVALFFFLIEGQACLTWLDEALPLRKGQTRELLEEVRKVGHSVIVSTFITAGVQAAAALGGYLIARVPHPLFFAAVTFFCAIIPAVGAAAIVVAAAGLLLLTGHPYFALFLALWGVVVVGLVDNLVKPLLIRGKSELNGAVVFFALLGGIAAFGALGLLIGPLMVALFLALLRMYHRDVAPRGRSLQRIEAPVKPGPAARARAHPTPHA
ncbi:MAG: AI-2E family transporter [Archangiaceae bacterium]|nr:AI-2E family transporter [Archangiaceae bacterium]